jgi:uncharacterized repeat protein (TIGR02543 family)
MFNLKHPMSIRLQRWMTVVLALGVLTIAPISSEKLLPSASAGTFSNSWSVAANTLTTSSPKNGARGSSCYVERHTLTGVADGTNIQLYMRARSGTVNGITMGNYDAYLYVVNKTTGVAVAQDDDNGTGDGSGTGSWGNDSYLTVTWYSNYEIQATTFSCGVVGGYAIYSSAGTVSGGISANYTVTFNANNGTGSSSVSSITQASSGAAVTLATAGTLNRTGFTFTGWNTAADGSGTNYAAGSTYTPTSAITMYAQWNSTITYNANGATSGSIPTATTAKSSAGVTTLATNTGTLARTNYVFGGWNTNETGTGTSYAAGVTTYASTGNTTLYARWNSVISYDSNTATSGTVPANSTLFGSAGTLAINSGNLAKTNYTFAGWNTNRQGTGTNYAAGATNYPPAGAATLYAQWNSLVTYNANSSTSGSVPAATSIPPAGGTLALNTGNLAKTGATFVGWSTTSDGTGTFYAPGANYSNTGNVTLYAQYSVALSLSGSSTFGTNLGFSASSQAYVATNGIGRKTFTHVVSPTSPGITLDTSTANSAIIRVAATVLAGTYIDTITATDLTGATVTKVVTITVAAPMRFSASNATSVTTSAGRSATLSIATTGGNTGKTFTLTHISTPSSAGITLDTSTASTGTVTLNISSSVAAGSYIESITATDSSGVAISTAITVNVNAPPVLTYESATAGSNFTSLAFNGTNQYVTIPSNSNLVLGSNYTIEWWQYQTDSNLYPRVFSFGGSGLEVSIEGETFYYWLNGGIYTLATGVRVKNAWTHFAIVSRNNSLILYKNGVAQRAALTGVAVTSANMPSTGNLCIGSECNTTYYSMFGGRIANFTISNTPRYSGTSLSAASFTPGFFSTVDSNTLLALGAVNSEAKFTDSSSFSRTVTNVNSPTGNSSHPSGVSANISIVTTQGITKRSSAFTTSAGTGTKTFSISPTVDGITLDTSLANTAYIVIADTVTATNSTTARVINETVTVTDSLGSATSFNVAITVNPPIALTATTTSFTTTAGLMGYDTITATSNTGTGEITYSLVSNPISSGITLVPGASRNTVLTVARTVTAGTYYETVTATDSLGATTSIPITLTVNPGITLAGENGISTIRTSFGGTAQLKVIATNGASGRTFTMQAASVAQNAGITLDTTNAASGYALVKVAATVPANTYLETITVTDSQGGTARLLVTVIVNVAPTLTGPTTITMTAGKPASTTAYTAASGTGAKTLTLTGLNTGVTIDTSTANSAIVNLSSSLTSTSSTVARVINETITATDESGAVARVALRITVNPAVIETATATSITTTSGIAKTVTIYASQGTGNKTFTRTSAVASSAITMSSTVVNQAVLTIGALTSPGTYYETITATDSLLAETSTVITIIVNGPPTISGTTNLFTTQGVTFNSPLFQAFSGNGSYTFTLVSNPTAAGITVTSPSAGYARVSVSSAVSAGTYNETLTVTDGLGATGLMTFTIRVNAPVALTGTQTISATYGEAFSTGFNSSGGTGPFTFSASNVCAVSRSTFIGDGANGTIAGTSYTVDRILGTGTCNWVTPAGVDSATALVVGAGGAGGTAAYGSSGGGGGGQVRELNLSLTPLSTVQVVVGSGGVPTPTGSVGSISSSGNGESSSIAPSGGATTSALGGGGGANSRIYNVTQGVGSTTGWSGGGGSAHAATASNGSTGVGGAGSKGGDAWPNGSLADPQAAGGGGGAGGAGANAVSGAAGAGGIGIQSAITGTAIFYGGGGGGGKRTSSGSAGTASGGGGAGGKTAGGTNGSANTGGGGGGAAEVNLGGVGGSGIVALRYVTPTAEADNSKISYLVSSAGTSTAAGLLTLSIPEAVNAGTYSHTVKVTDSTGSVSSPVTINITVNKANPVVTLSLPGAANSTQYGFGVQLSAQASTAGRVQFKDNGTEITGCGSKATTSFVATCRWVPNTVATRTITAVFTPTDTSNYNTGITASMSVVVTKADTLTVTSVSENFTFTNSPAAVTERFTLNGLAEIDSVTISTGSITTNYIGTANDSSTVNSTTAPSKAGDNYEIQPSALVFATGSASNYANIVYVSGVLAIARAVNNGNFNYSSSNQLTYSPTGIDTPTVTTFGEATPVYSGANPEKCSIYSSTGALSIRQAGTCTVTMDVPEGYNYLSTSVTKNVIINKASRTISLSAASPSLKYGDTATVTTTISAGSDDGTLTYASSFPSVCQYDDAGGEILAISGSGNCVLNAQIAEGTNYLMATSNTLTVTAILADAPVVTTDTLNPVSYNNGNAISVNPSVTVTGLKRNDAVGSVTFTYTFASSPAGTFSYSSTTVPTEGGIYSVMPSTLSLSTGSLSNYQVPSYVSTYLEVEQIDQPELLIQNLTGELTFPIKLITSGGAPAITSVVYTVTAATATNCRVVYGPIVAGGESIWTLQADSAGSCSVRAGKLQNRNFRTVISETATVSVLQFVQFVQPTVSNFTTGVTISASVPLTVGQRACTSGCTPRIDSISSYTGYVGDMLVLTGINFSGATRVVFNVFTNATNFSNDPSTPDTQITVQVPTGLTAGEVGIEVVTPGGTSPRNFDFELLP